jgi:hypothetical protein
LAETLPSGIGFVAKATDNAEHPNSSTSQPKKATDLTPPVKPSVVGTLDFGCSALSVALAETLPSGIGFVGVIVT